MPRSTKSVSLNQLRVGIFVLVAIVILIFLILNASGDVNPFKKRLHLKARFGDANGLREGSEVRVSGVRVGKVNDVAASGTDLAQRLSKLSDQMSVIVKDVQEGKGTVGRLFSDEALYNNLNATIRETEDVMQAVRSGNGSAGRFINDPAPS